MPPKGKTSADCAAALWAQQFEKHCSEGEHPNAEDEVKWLFLRLPALVRSSGPFLASLSPPIERIFMEAKLPPTALYADVYEALVYLRKHRAEWTKNRTQKAKYYCSELQTLLGV